MRLRERASTALRSLQWNRGLRAGLAVSVAMTVCHLLGKPMGWAALGGFEAVLVDNGGPYRSRLATMVTLMAGGAAGCVIASMTAPHLLWSCAAAAVFCFAITFARVVAQPIASTSVIILVIYFAGVGTAEHTFAGAMGDAWEFVLGCAWAAALSLVLWPLDPFRPARLSVAGCYRILAGFTVGLAWSRPHSVEREAARARTQAFQRAMRVKMEEARRALGATAARSASRTVRARNLSVLLETADLLFAETLRWTELYERADDAAARVAMDEAVRWLSAVERTVAMALEQRPRDGAASFAPEGSYSLQYARGRAALAERLRAEAGIVGHLGADEQDALQNVEIAFEAVRAVWTGSERRAAPAPAGDPVRNDSVWAASMREALRTHWTPDSIMLHHALRVAIVAVVDLLLLRVVHVQHGTWMATASIIVLQPYGSAATRRGAQRVAGTIAGGVLAAALAAAIHSEAGVIAVITFTSVMALALYAVDYGWYAFFLTPTFVLMSLPHLRDWRYAGVRMGTTVVGALVAVLAMRLLWPQQEEGHLRTLLGRAAAAEAEYLRAVVRFWAAGEQGRREAERAVLAPARRAAGLRILEAEETLDRLMLEPSLGRRNGSESRAEALTLITYLRRLMRSAGMLAAVGLPGAEERVNSLAERMEVLGICLVGGGSLAAAAERIASAETAVASVGEQQMQRMERQVGILERAGRSLHLRDRV